MGKHTLNILFIQSNVLKSALRTSNEPNHIDINSLCLHLREYAYRIQIEQGSISVACVFCLNKALFADFNISITDIINTYEGIIIDSKVIYGS